MGTTTKCTYVVVCPKTKVEGGGGVFRNNKSDWVLGYMKGIPHTTSVEAELHALWQGLKIALDQNFILLEISTNSEQIIKLIKQGNLHYNFIVF